MKYNELNMHVLLTVIICVVEYVRMCVGFFNVGCGVMRVCLPMVFLCKPRASAQSTDDDALDVARFPPEIRGARY